MVSLYDPTNKSIIKKFVINQFNRAVTVEPIWIKLAIDIVLDYYMLLFIRVLRERICRWKLIKLIVCFENISNVARIINVS